MRGVQDLTKTISEHVTLILLSLSVIAKIKMWLLNQTHAKQTHFLLLLLSYNHIPAYYIHQLSIFNSS